jgi:type IV pilus assembly protein PilB
MKLRKDLPGEEATSEAGGDTSGARRGGQRTPGSPSNSRTLLGELLVGAQLITHDQLAEALLQQSSSGERIGNLLVELGAIGERDLARALASQLLVPLVDLSQQAPSPEAIDVLPESVARSHLAVPLVLDDKGLTIAVSDPNPELAKVLANACGRVVRLVIAPRSDIQRAIDTAYRALGSIHEHVRAFEQTAEAPRRPAADTAVQMAVADNAPVVQVVNLLITQAMRDRASDIHIEPQGQQLRIRFRIDGALHDAVELPLVMAPALVSRLKIMADMNIVERRRPQDGQITMTVDGREIDIRVSTMATIWGETCVLRVLDKSRSLFRMGDLGMPLETHEIFTRLIGAPFGMVLCAGPTGSGKTTTLYAALSEIDEPSKNIMTIEDPVEYVFPTINQIQTNEQAGISFANGLRSILRQDPDVILVGEIRDVETARIAVQSALTGHFVLSSLHATDSAAALHRFLDMGIESFLVASSVLAVVSQRLVRRICQTCKAPYEPKDEEVAFYVESGGLPKRQFLHGEGCNFCAGTGYRDRIGVYELMRISPEIKRLIVGWATQEELHRMAVSQGMRSLRDEAIRLVADDITTISEVIRSIYTA